MQPTQTVIITGGNAGLGYQAAKHLALAGAWHVIVASRNPERTAAGVEALKRETGYAHISAMTLDLGDLASVRHFAADFAAHTDLPPLTAIICNAGVSLMGDRRSVDGYEMTFAVNHLGHFLLVNLLLKHLTAPARIVFVSSGTHIPEHRLARISGVPKPRYTTARALALPDEAAPEDRVTNSFRRYSTSKLCNVLCAYELSRRLEAAGISTVTAPVDVFALDPGLMPGTGLVREAPDWFAAIFAGVVKAIAPLVAGIRLPEQSGEHLARLVIDPALAGLKTAYFDGQRQTRSSADSYDASLAHDLWETSGSLSHLTSDETPLGLGAAVNIM